ncbi:hypothetical protein L2E82_10517 [Cichorium intybus]|uniref:Uncharacterized protein n=1 Tax=Cichorium intybus TaxID=13427 RepID=A0ACB9GBT1_CICIN|nr:hypothetical protein L2E82_10517 [Cichorium intybus]
MRKKSKRFTYFITYAEEIRTVYRKFRLFRCGRNPVLKNPRITRKPPQQLSSPPKSRTSPSGFSTHKKFPNRRKPGNDVWEIKQRFWDVMRQFRDHAENHNPPQAMVERPHDGCFRSNN